MTIDSKEPAAPNYSVERWEQATHVSNAAPSESVFVAWTAPWCGPCKSTKRVLERVAAEMGKHLYIVNVDEIKGMAVAFNVRSVPTIMELKDGFPTSRRLVGGQGETAIREYLNG